VKIEHQLAKLNTALGMYVRASGRSVAFGLVKQSSELGRNLVMASKGLMPEKGKIRAERLEAFKRGEGIRVGATARKYADSKTIASASNLRTKKAAVFVEKTARGKIKKDGRNWWQLAVDRELSLREAGRGFVAHAQRMPLMLPTEAARYKTLQRRLSRYGPQLGEFAITANSDVSNGEVGSAVFTWGGFSELSNDAVKAMGRVKGQKAIADALEATVDNIIPYLERKLGEDAAKIFAQ
jgi:hypothetical protein